MAVVSAVIEDLSAMSRTDSSTFVLVYLPTLDDYLHPPDLWRQRIRAAAEREPNILFVDLIDELRRLPPDSVVAMFIPSPTTDVDTEGRGHGHYSVAGNQWVADQPFRRLQTLPRIASRMHRQAERGRAPSRVCFTQRTDTGCPAGVPTARPPGSAPARSVERPGPARGGT
jgi:hypothetical protein